MENFFTMLSESPEQGRRGPSKVLAVRGGALGDFILTLPSLRVLGAAGYEVELLTRPAYGRLAREAGWVSGWRSLEAPEVMSLLVLDAPVEADWQEWLSGFEAVISWLPDQDGAFQAQMLRCRVSQFYQGDWRCCGLGPAAQQLAEAVQFTGEPVVALTDLFSGSSTPLGVRKREVAIHLGSGSSRKNWPLEHWIAVMKFLHHQQPQICWLVITGESEEGRLPEIVAALTDSGLRWVGAHGLELGALSLRLRGCAVLFGHDSGISHLAAACGVPCRLLFGPTDPVIWAPQGKDVEVLRAPGGALMDHGVAEVCRQWGGSGFARLLR